MSGYTKGPWRLQDGHYPSMKEINGPSFNITVVMSATDISFEEYLRRDADARLIAAAPDLLEALEDLVKSNVEHNKRVAEIVGKPTGWHDGYLDKGRAAIAKAKGEHQ